MAENFFSILKTECIYRHKPKTIREANELIDRYIYFYNNERIQNKTGVAPLTLRHSLKTKYFLHRGLFVLSVQTGAVHFGAGLFCQKGNRFDDKGIGCGKEGSK